MKYSEQQVFMKDYKDFTDHRDTVLPDSASTEQLTEFVDKAFPSRHQFKVDWLRLEQDIRRTMGLSTSYENRLMIIDILLGEHTGRGTQLVQLR